MRRECPFCHKRVDQTTERDPRDHELYLVDAVPHICRDCPFEIGDELDGFCFSKEDGGGSVHGKITRIEPCVLYSYHLDSGDIVGVFDDIYTTRKRASNE